jgi:hypothetical protein
VKLPVPSTGPYAPLDIIALGSAGHWAAVLPSGAPGEPVRVVNYDPVRGGVQTLLTTFQVPVDGTAHLVSADASGQHLLFIVYIPAPKIPGSTTPDTNDLYQWNDGDAQPMRLASDIVAASW